MQIKSFLANNPRKKFLIQSNSDGVPISDILKLLNKSSLGFCVINVKNKYKILTDGDFRRNVVKDPNFVFAKSKNITFKKILTIDLNETMYKAFRIMSENEINCILVEKNKKIFSYVTLHEINESLSPERLNLDKNKLKKFELDINKHLIRYNFANLFIKEKA